METTKTKILFFDIETAPNLGYIWGKYEQNVIGYEREWYMLCYAAKWLDGKMMAKALPDFKGYKPGSDDDKALVTELWKLFDEADIIVAHNGDQFDIRKTNARFLFHKLPPPSPYKTVDTKKVAKRVAAFNSNKLDDLGGYFLEGKKIKTDFALWRGCMSGDKKAWADMIRYNMQDVILLEKVYLRLRPYMKNHPNMGIYQDEAVCPKCGSKHIQFRGYAITQSSKYRRFQCKNCAGWGRTTKNIQEIKPLVSM